MCAVRECGAIRPLTEVRNDRPDTKSWQVDHSSAHKIAKDRNDARVRKSKSHEEKKDENARLNVKNQIVNDYQMWHINDTITFTPFKNIELIDLSLCADADTIIRQVTHAELSFAIIKRLNPTNLQRVRMHKNGVVA